MSDDEYEEKIAGLVARSYAADIARDPTAKKRWADAFRVLSQGDHYILIAINRALGPKFRPWWKPRWQARASVETARARGCEVEDLSRC
jgi:hypothetical protein